MQSDTPLVKNTNRKVTKFIAKLILACILILFLRFWLSVASTPAEVVVVIISLLLTSHGMFTLSWMLYSWDNPEEAYRHKSPTTFKNPIITFTALLPARHEEKVIAQTVRALSRMNYPQTMCEIVILCREDDEETINAVNKELTDLNLANVRLKVFNDYPINKPHSLNIGLQESNYDVIAVFDAEDEPHPDLFNIVNTVMLNERVEIVQSGVQLMNYKTKWYSLFNCMEYYFWFKSGLLFFTNIGNVSPLGGNTVFFIREFLLRVGGWDEKCLTEDADIGITLAGKGAKVKVIYDEQHVTKEEAPISVEGFIKQRTRWNHGFLQILMKGSWLKLSSTRQKITTLYVLLTPMFQLINVFYIPIGLYIAFTSKVLILISLLSFTPLFLLTLQISTIMIGSHGFTKSYDLKYNWYLPFLIIFMYIPYQVLLITSSVRASVRFLFNKNIWEKTTHVNAHRKIVYNDYIKQIS